MNPSPCSACLYVDAQVRCLDCGRPLCLDHLPLHYCHPISETRLIDCRISGFEWPIGGHRMRD